MHLPLAENPLWLPGAVRMVSEPCGLSSRPSHLARVAEAAKVPRPSKLLAPRLSQFLAFLSGTPIPLSTSCSSRALGQGFSPLPPLHTAELTMLLGIALFPVSLAGIEV